MCRQRLSPRLTALLLASAFLLAAPVEAQLPTLQSQVIVTGLSLPLAFVQDPTNPAVQFVVQQGGRIRPVVNGALQPTDFLNLTGVISSGGERGLLGLAFAPDYATSRRFFVNFTNPQGHTVIARFRRSAGNALVADAASRFDLLWPTGDRFIFQDFANHNGGNIAFGPDGYLYIGMGDGGDGNDPYNRAQNPNSLLGKMLRINVNVSDGDVEGYDVPSDNPFVDNLPIPALDEIWAFGLRNPWRWSFDDPSRGGTGALLIGDVGQNAWEEVDYEPAGAGGRNYGWRVREGAHNNVTGLGLAYGPGSEPIHEYSHSVGSSITGGFVYRGTALGLSYRGRYFFADFVAGRVWSVALTQGGGTATVSNLVEHTAQLGAIGQVSSFGIDASGELYVINYGQGRILRLLKACPATLVPQPGSFSASGGAGVLTVNIGAGCSWTAASNDSFITVPPGSTSIGPGIVNYTVSPNTGAANVATGSRTGTISVADETATIGQTGCTFQRAPLSASYTASGGTGSVSVTTPSACSWTAVANDGFLNVTGGAAGTGPGTVTYSVASHAGAINVANAPRSGSLNVAGGPVAIFQTGCTFSLSPTGTTFGAEGGSGSVQMNTASVCGWNVSGLPAWATTQGGGSATGSAVWTYGVAVNASGFLRSDDIQLGDQTFSLSQLASTLKPLVPGTRTALTLTNGSEESWSSIEAMGGRSYCARVEHGTTSDLRSTPTLTAIRSDGTTVLAGGLSATACFVAPTTETTLLRVTQAEGSPRAYRLSVVESTLWANWFFTAGSYSSFTLLRNTSASPVDATLTWRGADGVVAGSDTVSIPAGATILRDARVVAPGATSGSVEIAHTGDTHAIVGSQTTLAAATGLSFDTVTLQRSPW
jgi:glucose/arabinose dehydrogenase